jgi:hypothetical protein
VENLRNECRPVKTNIKPTAEKRVAVQNLVEGKDFRGGKKRFCNSRKVKPRITNFPGVISSLAVYWPRHFGVYERQNTSLKVLKTCASYWRYHVFAGLWSRYSPVRVIAHLA